MSNNAQVPSFKPVPNKKVSFIVKDEVPVNVSLSEVLDSNILKGLYKNDLFEVVNIDDVKTDDFVFVLGHGLFQIKSRKV